MTNKSGTPKNLEKLMKLVDHDKIMSQEDMDELLSAVITILAENKKSVEGVSADTKQKVEEVLSYIEAHRSEIEQTKGDIDKTRAEIEKAVKSQNDRAFKRLQELINNFKYPENGKDGRDGRDADEEAVVEKVLAKIKLPEHKVVTPEDVKEQLSTLEDDDKDELFTLLGSKKLKDLDDSMEQRFADALNRIRLTRGVKEIVAGSNVTVSTDGNGVVTISSTGGGSGDVTTDAIWDAKGDLAVGTGANTASRLAVGANGTVLTADSAEATGVKWASVAGTGDFVGPASSTDNAIVRFNGTTGKLGQNSTVTIGDTGAIATTIANTSNVVGLAVTQNDTTNNPRAVTITNAGTGNGMLIQQDGAGTALYIDSSGSINGAGQAMHITHDGTGSGGWAVVEIDNNVTGTGATPSMRIRHGASAAGSNPAIRINTEGGTSQAMYIQHDSTGDMFFFDVNTTAQVFDVDQDVTNSNWTTGSFAMVNTAVVDDAATYTKTGSVFAITSNVIETSGTITDSAIVLDINQTHADATGSVVTIDNAGTADALTISQTGVLGANAGALRILPSGDLSGSNRYGQRIYTNTAHTGGGRLLDIVNDHASSLAALIVLTQDGVGTTQTNDVNNNAIAANFDKDVTNANNSTNTVVIDNTSVVNDAGTYTKTGPNLILTSNVIETSGTITDSAIVLSINQNHADATGDVLYVNNDGAGTAINVQQDGTLNANEYATQIQINSDLSANNRQGLRIYSNFAHTGAGRMFYSSQDNVASVSDHMYLHEDGTPPNGVLFIDNNNNGRSINVDQDGNSASLITGLWVNTANAGAGGARGLFVEAGYSEFTNLVQIGAASVLAGSVINPLQIAGTANSYFASYVQNKSNGTSASTDITAGNDIDDGSVTTGHYIDMGVNSSTFSDAGFTFGTANDTYLYGVGGDLVIGAGTSAKNIEFFTGGFLLANRRARITATGLEVGLTGTLTGQIRLLGSTSGTAIITPGAAAGTPTLTLPTTSGTFYVTGGTDVALADGGTGASLADPNADRILFWDDSAGAMTWLTVGTNLTITGTTLDAASGSLSDGDKGDITVSSSGTVWNIDAATVGVTELSATGTPSASTYLRGDNTWATVAGTGDVSKVGTPLNNQIGVWTGDGTIEGDTALTFDTATDTLSTVDLSLSNDLLLATGSIINWASSDVTLTHSSNLLAFAGSASGYTFEAAAGASNREQIAKFTVSDAANDAFYIGNGTTANARFNPTFFGIHNTGSDRTCMEFKGVVTSANDTGSTGIVRFNTHVASSASDPLNTFTGAVTTRPVFIFANADSPALTINANLTSTFAGDVSVPDEAYGVGWNGSLEVPTKNAVYDKIEASALPTQTGNARKYLRTDASTATWANAHGNLTTFTVAANTSSAEDKLHADYVCDGTADNVEIQSAIDLVKAAGGTVQLAAGTYNCAAALVIDGPGGADGPTVGLVGQGNETTILNMANNIDGIQLTDDPKVKIHDIQIKVLGTGNGIKSTAEATTYRGFWNSSFKNIYVKGDFSTHSGWAMYLEGPFRSTFENIEANGVGNGVYLTATNSAFNPGNLLFMRCFMDLSQANGVGWKLNTPNGGGQFNICTFIQCEAIDSEATSTTSIGWHFRGSATTYHNTKNIYILSSNVESFNTALKFEHATSNSLHFNYVDTKTGGTIADFSSDSAGNDVTIMSGYVAPSTTSNLVVDANTNAIAPNVIRRYEGYVDTAATLGATITSATQFDRINATGPGTIDSDIVLGETTFASDIQVPDEVYGAGWNGSTEVPTKNAVYDKIEAIPALTDGDKGDITVSSSGTVWTVDAGTITDAKISSSADVLLDSKGITLDGGGSAITTGLKGYLEIPYNCTITKVTMLADVSGSAVVDIWKDTYANYPPLVADTITASAKPTITAAVKSTDSTLTGWTTTCTAGDILAFNVDSASTITRLHVSLTLKRT